MKRIDKIKVHHLIDESPDTSYLGEFSDRPETEYAIDQRERSGEDNCVLQFFNPASAVDCKDEPAEDIRRYAEQEYQRMMALERGDWQYIGITAVAEVAASLDVGKTWKLDKLTSGGLWGIESDSDQAYLQEIIDEEKRELRAYLLEYGFTAEEIDARMGDPER
jgi:hypothetical protein